MRPAHVAGLALVFIVAIAAAVFFARPEMFRRATLQLEDVLDQAAGAPAAGAIAFDDLQIAGIRTLYDSEYKPRVKYVIINHSEAARRAVDLEVQLRPKGADPASEPLASFLIQLDTELGGKESREIETELKALGTLASLPRWDEGRLSVVSQAAQSTASEQP